MTNGNGDGIYNHHSALGNFMGTETMFFFPALYDSGMINEKHSNCNTFYNCTLATAANWSGHIGSPGLFPENKIVPKTAMAIVGGLRGGIYYFLGVNTSGLAYYNALSSAGIIPAAQAAAFDQKLDDGFASTGSVYASTNRETINSSCGALCSVYTDTTVMQLDTTNGACTNTGTPRKYNTTSTNLCRLVVESESVANN